MIRGTQHDGVIKGVRFTHSGGSDERNIDVVEIIENINSIDSFCLYQKNIGEEEAEVLADALRNNTSVTSIRLGHNNIGINGAQALADMLKNNSSITFLDLNHNNIGGWGAEALAAMLKNNSSITNINLQGNDIGTKNFRGTELRVEGVKALADGLRSNTTVTAINLGYNNIDDEGIEALANGLRSNTTVTAINLGGNKISVKGAKAIAAMFWNHASINVINLFHSDIDDEKAKILASGLKNNTSITYIDFYGNKIGDEGAKALADGLKNNTSITFIDLMNNKISDAGAKAFADMLGNNTSITYIDFYGNKIGDEGAKALADGLKDNAFITYISLHYNNMSDEKRKIIYDLVEKNKAVVATQKNTENNHQTTNNGKVQHDEPEQAVLQDYDVGKVTNLLAAELTGKQYLQQIMRIEQKMPKEQLPGYIDPVIAEANKMAVLAIQTIDHHWHGLIIQNIASSSEAPSLKLLYINPLGQKYTENKAIQSLIDNILENYEGKNEVLDCAQKQVEVAANSGAAVIESLVKLAQTNDLNITVDELKNSLLEIGSIGSIMVKHFLIQDTNSWYSDDKISELLKVSLDNTAIKIAAVTVFAHEQLLIENVTAAVQDVMANNQPVVMPLHMHGNHWTGLVIKKLSNDAILVLYNDPKGQPLVAEKNFGALIKAIFTVKPNISIIDLQVQLQHNGDDCGPWTVASLIKLASEPTTMTSYTELQQLLQSMTADNANHLRLEQAMKLIAAGIPVPISDMLDKAADAEDNQYDSAADNSGEIDYNHVQQTEISLLMVGESLDPHHSEIP